MWQINYVIILYWSIFFKVVGEKEFQVHRVVLAARSPVFKAMFDMFDMAEGITGRAIVEDIHPDDMVNKQLFLKQTQSMKWMRFCSFLKFCFW